MKKAIPIILIAVLLLTPAAWAGKKAAVAPFDFTVVVVDGNGNRVEGAAVQLVNQDTGQTYEGVSDANGEAVINIAPGNYTTIINEMQNDPIQAGPNVPSREFGIVSAGEA